MIGPPEHQRVFKMRRGLFRLIWIVKADAPKPLPPLASFPHVLLALTLMLTPFYALNLSQTDARPLLVKSQYGPNQPHVLRRHKKLARARPHIIP